MALDFSQDKKGRVAPGVSIIDRLKRRGRSKAKNMDNSYRGAYGTARCDCARAARGGWGWTEALGVPHTGDPINNISWLAPLRV